MEHRGWKEAPSRAGMMLTTCSGVRQIPVRTVGNLPLDGCVKRSGRAEPLDALEQCLTWLKYSWARSPPMGFAEASATSVFSFA